MRYRFPTLLLLVLFGCVGAVRATPDIREAARTGDVDAVRELLDARPRLVGEPDDRDCRPIHFAAGENRLDVIDLLLDRGADIEARDVDGDTPLHWAAVAGHDDAVKRLLDRGAAIDARNREEATPLLYATYRRRLSTIKLLVRRGADLEIPNDYGRTPLIWNCREGGDLDTARLLLELGADPNALDRFHDSALSLAAWRGFHELVGLLLDAGARTDINPRVANDLVIHAIEKGGDRLYERMARDGAAVDVSANRFGKSNLHLAAAGGSAAIVGDLLRRGASLDQKDLYGFTPLHYAADRGRLEVAALLVKAGAPMNERTNSGDSAVNLAEKRGASQLVRLLRSNGADTSPRRFPRLTTPLLGQGEPPAAPAPFAPGLVATCHGEHGSVTIAPDGREIYWAGGTETPDEGYSYGTILCSRLVDGRWTAPERASFAMDRGDDVPCFAPDGRRLFFISRREAPPGYGSGGERIWYVEREGDGWSEPAPLPSEINDMRQHWQFTVADNGNLYFSSHRNEDGTRGLYVTRPVNGVYGRPEFLGFGGQTPKVAPDESWLMTFEFMENNRRGNLIRFREPDGGWGEPIDLTDHIPGGGGICPGFSPDGGAFFYISQATGANNIFWVDADWLAALKRSRGRR